LRGFKVRAGREQGIAEELESPRRGDARIQHPHRAGRGIARVGEARQLLLLALLVQALECGARHEHLAAHLEIRRKAGRRSIHAERMERMVRRFSVTSSPILPSPRVSPCAKRRLRYFSAMLRPSSLSSAT